MQIRQTRIRDVEADKLGDLRAIEPQLVLVFGPVQTIGAPGFFAAMSAALPGAALVGCSTAGEISGDGVSDGECIVTALRFDSVTLRVGEAEIPTMAASTEAGRAIGRALAAPDLRGVLLFGKGIDVNGSALIEGVIAELGDGVPVSGGLAGDGGAFAATRTLTPSGVFADRAVAVGLYGDKLRLTHGSFGGWTPFGPARKVTRSAGNVLYELDGMPALELYRQYLGDYAAKLPASGLLFPFEMLREDHSTVGLIRTILGIDEAAGALVLAGDIDADGHLRLMHASADALAEGAGTAARRAADGLAGGPGAGLGILVSCVGRKLVMGDAVEEEVEAVAAELGKAATLCGFYSYGEIAPFSSTTRCELHNQTMTVTFIGEQGDE